MTRKGYEKLMAELVELRSTGRAEISRQLEEARSFGDLSENAEYAASKEEQAKLETRISRRIPAQQRKNLDFQHRRQQVTPGSPSHQDIINSQKFAYTTSVRRVRPQGKQDILFCPVGQALLNKTVGDEVHVKVPAECGISG